MGENVVSRHQVLLLNPIFIGFLLPLEISSYAIVVVVADDQDRPTGDVVKTHFSSADLDRFFFLKKFVRAQFVSSRARGWLRGFHTYFPEGVFGVCGDRPLSLYEFAAAAVAAAVTAAGCFLSLYSR